MHELSLVEGILEIAREQATAHHAQSVDCIELDMGALDAVDPDAFDFAWKAATPATVLAQAQCIIHRIPGRARCMICDHEFEVEQYFDECPKCGSFRKEITGGAGLKVKRITLT